VLFAIKLLFYLCPGWLRAWPAHLSPVRPLLSRGPEAVLSRGLRNWCCDLHPGKRVREWVSVFFPPCFNFDPSLCWLGALHRVHWEAPRVQQVGLETLQDDPRGRRLVRPQQRAEGHDDVSQFLDPAGRGPAAGWCCAIFFKEVNSFVMMKKAVFPSHSYW